MKVALDPYMFRTTPLTELPGLVADLGYEYIELSPREDFIPFFRHPRVDRATIAAFKAALAGAGVEVSSLLPLFRWSGPDEDERQAAVRYWKRSIEIAVELGVTVMNSELNGRPEQAEPLGGDVLAVDGRAAADLRAGGHPAPPRAASRRLRRGREGRRRPGAGHRLARRDATCTARRTPSTWAATWRGSCEHAGDLVTHVHVADSFDHRASSGLRYILNPPGTTARIHQHLDIGQGEVDWDAFFGTLGRDALRRHHDRVRIRVGGAGPGVEPAQPGGDPAPHGVVDAPRLTADPLAPPVASTTDEPVAAVNSRRTALILLALLSVIWGVHWAIVKVGLDYVPPITYAASRVAIALALLVVLLGVQGRLRMPDRSNLSIILSIGLVQVAAGVVLQNLALQVVDAGRSAVLVYTMPLWVAVILVIAFRTRPTRYELIGLVLGIGGLVLLLNPATIDWNKPGEIAGALGLLLNAVLWAAVTIHIRRHRWTQSPLDLQPWQLLAALIPLAILAIGVEHGEGIRWEPATLLFLLYSGVLATAFAVWATQAITRTLGPQASATGFLAIPVVGLLSGWLFLGETLGPLDLLGFGLVLGGVAVTSFLVPRR